MVATGSLPFAAFIVTLMFTCLPSSRSRYEFCRFSIVWPRRCCCLSGLFFSASMSAFDVVATS